MSNQVKTIPILYLNARYCRIIEKDSIFTLKCWLLYENLYGVVSISSKRERWLHFNLEQIADCGQLCPTCFDFVGRMEIAIELSNV
jgi:hypothetical protein